MVPLTHTLAVGVVMGCDATAAATLRMLTLLPLQSLSLAPLHACC